MTLWGHGRATTLQQVYSGLDELCFGAAPQAELPATSGREPQRNAMLQLGARWDPLRVVLLENLKHLDVPAEVFLAYPNLALNALESSQLADDPKGLRVYGLQVLYQLHPL